ncbi:MAG TPA: zinc-binding dehydrogenase, partial [Anaerolineales bacterium]|nr:zinc-binding dehydrogenase [Anaerolineales bacterium]
MKAARLHAPGKLTLEDESIPVAGPGEVLVRVRAVGICGSDLHWFSEAGIGDARLGRPLVLGHECSGVTETGARVAVDPAIPCGKCEWCLRGDPNLCPDVRFAGHGEQDGALREWIAWPEDRLHPLPDSVTDTDGALLEPLGVAMQAVDLAHLRTGMTVGVFGCGPIGLLIVQLAALSGASHIVATDLHAHRLAAAREFGAHTGITAAAGNELARILTSVKGRGVDVAFEVAGEQAAVDVAVEAARPGGKVILAGIPSDDRSSFTASTARRKGLTIKMVRRMKHTYPRSIELVASGKIQLAPLVTHRFPLDRVNEAFETARRREGVKV